MKNITKRCLVAFLALSFLSCGLTAQEHLEKLTAGNVDLKMAGPMAFGPDGVLFIGDPSAACVYALDTADRESGEFQAFEVENIDEKVAAALGTTKDAVRVNDMAVNPISGQVYLSVNGGDAGIILKVSQSGEISEFALKDIKHAVANLPNAPGEDEKDRRGRSLRVNSITDISLIDNQIVVAGLSNEEFASNLRAIPYPFADDIEGTSIEVYHAAHGKYETNAPVRTFAGITLDNEPYVVAAYTCTPLVRFPLSDVTKGEKIRGTTVAELGNRNRPLDMFVYQKDGKKFILMANSHRGMMKISTEDIGRKEGLTSRVSRGTEGQPYETIDELKTTVQLDRFGENHAAIISQSDSGFDLKVIPLP